MERNANLNTEFQDLARRTERRGGGIVVTNLESASDSFVAAILSSQFGCAVKLRRS